MACAGRRLAVCLACCVVGLAVAPVVALGEGSSSAGSLTGEGGGASSPLGGTLVVSGGLEEGQQAQAAEEAKLSSPEAVTAREESQSKYEGLDSEQAAKLASEAFPEAIDHPAGTLPPLPAGQRVVGYPADDAAQVDLSGGKHGVIESGEPIAIETSPGQHEPLDLSLSEVGGAFQPARSGVDVRIPKQLADGVQVTGSGVSLTPVDEHGSALGGSEGVIDGATVLYANTQTDADTVVKPLTNGFEEDTLLRSVDSPSELSFRVGLPAGATLVSAKDDSGAMEVVDEGAVIASVAPPSARDAEGTVVPVSMSVSGDVLTVNVDQHAGSYRYPIDVDPTVTDSAFESGLYNGYDESWLFYNGSGSQFGGAWETFEDRAHDKMVIHNDVSLSEGEWAYFYYLTKGASQIYTWHAKAEGWGSNGTETDAETFIYSEKGLEGTPTVLPRTGTSEATVCALSGCAVPGSIESGRGANGAFFEAYAEKSGSSHFSYSAGETSVGIVQYAGPWVGFDTSDQTIEGYPNSLYGGGQWVKRQGRLEFEATDPGTGVDGLSWKSPNDSGWGKGIGPQIGKCKGGVQCEPCIGPQCSPSDPLPPEAYIEGLPEGEDTIEVTAKDGVGLTDTADATVKIDDAPPHSITVSGLGNGNQISEREYNLKAEATDGSGSIPSSGVKSIAVAVDGREIGKPQGSCPKGSCTASGEWAINGDEFGAGEHKLKVTATDNAGNVATEEFTFKVHHATSVAVGPGSVDPESGELSLNATDVSVGAPGSSLTVSRGYRSRHLTAGTEGPLGPQWTLSTGGQESILKLGSSATLTAAGGGQTTFTSNGKGGFTSPTGDTNLALSEVKNEKGELTEYVLKDAATSAITSFTSTSGPKASRWEPTKQEGPLASQTVRYIYQTVEGVTEPKWAIAPEPAGLSFSCVSKAAKSEKLEKGCRALEFKYAEKTKESIGETEKEWGEYKDRLKEILFVAYNPSIKAMTEPAVAQYAYDKQGRLRTEWNPQIASELKTTYGYDSEGHVTALTGPGQQPWAFTYGTIAGDANTGRLLKTTQAQPKAGASEKEIKEKLSEQKEAPKNTSESPKLSGTAIVGVTVGVSNGVWSGSPVAYGYQWEDCNTKGEACTPILGATNANYTVASSDVGHTLVALVTGTSGGGSVAASAASSEVHGVTGLETNQYSMTGDPHAITVGPDGNLWFTNWGQSKIGKITTSGTITEYSLPTNSYPDGIIAGPGKENALWFTDYDTSKIGKIATSGTITEYSVAAKTYPDSIAVGSDGNLWFTGIIGNTIGKITPTGTITEYKLPGGSQPGAITAGPDGNLWFTEYAGNKIGKITTSGVITTYSLPEESYPQYGLTAGPEKENALWFTEAHQPTNRIGKITTSGTVTEYSLPSGSEPHGITAGLHRDLWFTDYGTNKIGKITTSGAITEYPVTSQAASIWAITVGPDANLWVPVQNDIDKITALEGETEPAQPGSTIEYNVPLEGPEVPDQMGTNKETGEPEPEKWSQKDDPVYATAIFPPDEPQSWPASKYTRASITYLDELGRVVNTASPSGGISTTEYNETNDVVRTLSPDNRAAALKEECKSVSKKECKSAEVSKLLDTESTYEEKGSEPGTELLSTLGPQQTVKLSSGTQVEARAHTVYDYNEGAPSEGGPYHLVTKETQGAQYSGKEEEVRTTTTSYSGQSNLGWKLRKPTSVTTEPSGLKLAHTILYEASTGNVTETRMPASPGENSAHDTQTIYYTTAANTKYPGCGEHPEWANLPCQTQPAKQPETSGLPNLPITTVTYNIWDEPEKTTETVGAKTRTKTATYEASGRLEKSAISSTVGTALPAVTDEYNKETGVLDKQSTTTEGKTKTITSVYNTLGELVSYTDADENTSTYEYDIDGRIKKTNNGKGTETFTYNETTGLLTELLNEYGTTKLPFTATYDVEGNMTSEGLPNGMEVKYTHSAAGEVTSQEDVKTTHCTEKCTWFSDAVVPSIHGQWLEQTSTLSHRAYTYDAAGRLTEVQNTPAGKGCTTRVYAYEEDTNRTSLKTYEPGTEGKCATEKGTEEKHTYDTADRLTDTGVKYSEFGNITNLPSSDAGGSELTSSFYTDNQLASETQNGQTIGYNLDPDGRTIETVATGKRTETVTNHYAGPGSTPAWTVNTAGETTRNISGISGFAATQSNTEAPVLQLTNLHGDIIATAYTSETATGLASTADTSEFGVPATSLPPKYSWLGADEIPTELPSGILDMGARSYIPQLGRFLQPDPISGGSANAYTYTFGDPVNTSDPSGESTTGVPPLWAIEAGAQVAEEAVARRAAEEAAARAEAERKWKEEEAASAASMAALLNFGHEWVAPEWWCGGEYKACEEEGTWEGVNPGLIDGISIRQGFCAGLGALVIACSPQTRPDEGPPSGRYSPTPVERGGEGQGAKKSEEPRPGDDCDCEGFPDPDPDPDPVPSPGDFIDA
jgi:RHS repeat-associated protein